jgi:ferredoxin/flavodoxin---NADP+ reductase
VTYVILQPCCNDASCVPACPVDCIHPTPAERGFLSSEMMHIDPQTCIDCGACVAACPVDAIKSESDLSPEEEPFLDLNAEYFADPPSAPPDAAPAVNSAARRGDCSAARVAIVGSGPAAFYTAAELLAADVAQVNIFERQLTPYGLARYGVAPDHLSTRRISDVFRATATHKNLSLHLGVEVGQQISPQELLEYHDAVIYATGAPEGRLMGVPGDDLPGSHTAADFVAWYNGHPDHVDDVFDLSGDRVVVVGNGNVALDVARILLTEPDDLLRSDIAGHALEALRHSNVREVVVLGRRGPAEAAFSAPEIVALTQRTDLALVVEDRDLRALGEPFTADNRRDAALRAKVQRIMAIPRASAWSGNPDRRLVLRFLCSPVRLDGDTRVERLIVERNDLSVDDSGKVVAVRAGQLEPLETSMVLAAVGHRARPIPGLPFDDARGVIPNENGRVVDPATGDIVPGAYVTGWAARGPSGVIGTNRLSAAVTAAFVLQDFTAGILRSPEKGDEQLGRLLAERGAADIDYHSTFNRAPLSVPITFTPGPAASAQPEVSA